MRWYLAAIWMLCCSGLAQAQTTRPASRPVEQIKKVMIVSIDGLRPDLVLRAKTPVMHQLFSTGSYSFWARTTAESVTLPSHTSMLTGVVPIKHGIQWNSDLPLEHPVFPAYPTIFELAHKAGYTTAMVAGKSKFINLAKPGTLDWQFIPEHKTMEDPDVTEQAIEIISKNKPDLLFVHLPSVDSVGHARGWATDAQIAAIERADGCVGQLLKALGDAGVRDQTMIIVTSDHGGAGRSHGPEDARSRHIPWIVNGPGIRENLDLTTYNDLIIDTEDTFSTTAAILAIPVERKVDGKFITQIIDQRGQELLKP